MYSLFYNAKQGMSFAGFQTDKQIKTPFINGGFISKHTTSIEVLIE